MIINSHIFVLFICSLTKKGDLPEGFFDDPKIDAKVRIPCSSRCSGVVDGVLHRYGKWSTWTHSGGSVGGVSEEHAEGI